MFLWLLLRRRLVCEDVETKTIICEEKMQAWTNINTREAGAEGNQAITIPNLSSLLVVYLEEVVTVTRN